MKRKFILWYSGCFLCALLLLLPSFPPVATAASTAAPHIQGLATEEDVAARSIEEALVKSVTLFVGLNPTIYTDSTTYFPSDLVSFHGRDFEPWIDVAVSLWKDGSFVSPIAQINANGVGSFDSSFSLSQDFPTGLYTLRAASELGSAETTFALILPSPGILAVTFQMQGAATSYTATFTVSFYHPGGTSPLFSRTVTIPALASSFTVAGVAAGTYDIKIKENRALSTLRTSVVVGSGTTTVNFGEQRVGDANGDDVINISDFSLLKASFGKSTGQAGYDGRADFDGNGVVNITDFSYLKSNFGRWGPL